MSQILCPVIYNQDFVTKKIVDSKHADGHTGKVYNYYPMEARHNFLQTLAEIIIRYRIFF